MSWTQLGGSLAAILALAGIARLLRLGDARIASPEQAMQRAEEALAGFVAARALVSGDGGAALVAGNDTVAVLKRHGAHVAIRRLVPPLRLAPAIEGVAVETGEAMFGSITLHGVIEPEVRALESTLTLV
ncbi:MAG: hypothetical protein ACKVOB_01165 [Sphingomonas sp.]